MYKLSKRSFGNLKTCHEDLQKIFALAIQLTPVDFIITEGHRSIARQNELFKKGASKIDGYKKLGKHNLSPSMAVDICAYVKGNKKLAFDPAHLAALGGSILASATILLSEGEITHQVRWGANWDMDGEILTDQRFDDMPHFELRKV
jgi:peptidoglycan L-alanyl-D-glutamate endopeptidase CwlK